MIVKLNETPIKSSSALIEYIGLKHPGDKVNVTVNRKGKEKSFAVTLKNREGKLGNLKLEPKVASASLSLILEDLDNKALKRLDLANGVRVKSVENGKVARYTEMRDGFIITHVNDKVVKTPEDIDEIVKSKKPGDLITFSGVYEDYPKEFNYAIRM